MSANRARSRGPPRRRAGASRCDSRPRRTGPRGAPRRRHRPREADRPERAALGAEAGDDLLVGRGRESPIRARPGASPLRAGRRRGAARARACRRPSPPASPSRSRRRRSTAARRTPRRCACSASRSRPVHRAGRGSARRRRDAPRDLEVGGVVAVLAGDERVLARARRGQVVERLAAAHHPATPPGRRASRARSASKIRS